jgi:large subunit ribosomal protein L30
MTAESTKKTTKKTAVEDKTKTAEKKAAASKTKKPAASAKGTAKKDDTKTAKTKTAASGAKKRASSAKKKAKKQLRITQVKSQIGFAENQRRVLAGLGLGRIGRTVVRPDDACIRGMVTKVTHLISVEEVEG